MTLGVPHRATGADEFLVHARWLSDYHRSHSRDVQTLGIALLGFTGVLTALLPNVVAALYDLPGDPSRVSRAALCSTAALLFATAFCAMQALCVRLGPEHPHRGRLSGVAQGPRRRAGVRPGHQLHRVAASRPRQPGQPGQG